MQIHAFIGPLKAGKWIRHGSKMSLSNHDRQIFSEEALYYLVLDYQDTLEGIQQLRGPNFTQFWPPTPPRVDILHNTYSLFRWPSMEFLLTTHPPLLVIVVIEWPLINLRKWKENLVKTYQNMNARSEIISVHFGETDSWPPKVVLNSQTQMSMTQNCRAHGENKACCQMRVCLSCFS